MLQQNARIRRTTPSGGLSLTPPQPQTNGVALDQPEDAGQASPTQVADWLRHFLIVISLIGIIACTFVWQANDIADIRYETVSLRRKAAQLEQDNARLMVRLAVVDSPANIEAEAARVGITGEKVPSVVVTPVQIILAGERQQNRLAALPEQLTQWASSLAQRGPDTAQ